MLTADRKTCATLALIVLASVAGIASAAARGEAPRERREFRSSEGERQGARRQAEARQNHRAQPVRADAGHSAARRQASYARERPAPGHPREMVARGAQERRPADGNARRGTQFPEGSRAHQASFGAPGGQARVVRYGNTLSGTVERTIRPGLVSRTFVSGGQVLYTHVYQSRVWYHFGAAFAYETFVPAVRFPAVYYGWALAAWPRPIAYAWGWQVQPWYPMYGYLFTPYPVYTSPDMWMTDYILSQSMQSAYQAQTPAPPPLPPGAPATPAADSGVAEPAAQPGDAAPIPQAGDLPPTPTPSAAPPAQSTDTTFAPPPPAITPQIKAELNTQIKVQLQEREAAEATPATLTTQSTPPALRPNHVFFEVIRPIDVPTANGYCSLRTSDYIKRTGGMSSDDWKIPVVVELSGPSDCPQGLQTSIGLNDLNAMENEQEARVMEAMQAASKSMGPNGPPAGPGVHPTLIAAGNAAPDPMALSAIRQAQ